MGRQLRRFCIFCGKGVGRASFGKMIFKKQRKNGNTAYGGRLFHNRCLVGAVHKKRGLEKLLE